MLQIGMLLCTPHACPAFLEVGAFAALDLMVQGQPKAACTDCQVVIAFGLQKQALAPSLPAEIGERWKASCDATLALDLPLLGVADSCCWMLLATGGLLMLGLQSAGGLFIDACADVSKSLLAAHWDCCLPLQEATSGTADNNLDDDEDEEEDDSDVESDDEEEAPPDKPSESCPPATLQP